MNVLLMLLQLHSGEKHFARAVRTLVVLFSSMDPLDMLVQTALTVVDTPTLFTDNSGRFLVEISVYVHVKLQLFGSSGGVVALWALVLFHVEMHYVGMGFQPGLGGILLVADGALPCLFCRVMPHLQVVHKHVVVNCLEFALFNLAVVYRLASPCHVVDH